MRPWPRRLSALDHNPWEARARLRVQFSLLRESEELLRGGPAHADDGSVTQWAGEEWLLALLQCGELTYPGPLSEGRGRWNFDLIEPLIPGLQATWDDLIREGWIRIVWQTYNVPAGIIVPNDRVAPRLRMLRALRERSRQPSLEVPDAKTLLAEHALRYRNTPSFEDLQSESGVLSTRDGRTIVNPRSSALDYAADWLAARLWDREHSNRPHDPRRRITWWRERLEATDIWSAQFLEQLAERDRTEFLDAAWDRILAEREARGWDREHRVAAAYLAADHGSEDVAGYVKGVRSPPTSSAIDLLSWVADVDPLHAGDALTSITRLLRALLRSRTHQPAFRANSWVEQYVSALITRPVLLRTLHHEVKRDPRLVADFISTPASACLGLGLLERCEPFVPNTFDVEARRGDALLQTRTAWRDGVETAMWAITKLDAEAIATEMAPLFDRLQGRANRLRADGRKDEAAVERLAILRSALSTWGHSPSAVGHPVIERIGAALVRNLRSRAADLSSPAFASALWVVARGSSLPSVWRDEAAVTVVSDYARFIAGRERWHWDALLNEDDLLALAGYLYARRRDTWSQFLEATDFERIRIQLGANGSGAEDVDAHSILHHVRTHVRTLAAVAARWSEVRPGERPPDDLARSLRKLLEVWTRALPTPRSSDQAEIAPGLFASEFEAAHDFGYGRAGSLIPVVAAALEACDEPARGEVMSVLLRDLIEPRQLATLSDALRTPALRESVREVLRKRPLSDGTDDISWFTEARATVDALLDVGAVDRAEYWLTVFAPKAAPKGLPDWDRWEVGARLRVLYLREAFDDILAFELPEPLNADRSAGDTVTFWRGLARLKLDQPESAASEFAALHQRAPHVGAYAVNLFAALATEALKQLGDDALSVDSRIRLRGVLDRGRELFDLLPADIQGLVRSTYETNRLRLLLRLEEWDAVLDAYRQLDADDKRDPRIVEVAAQAFERTGQDILAKHLRQDMGAPATSIGEPATVDQQGRVRSVREAIRDLPDFTAPDQARAWWNLDIGDALTRALVETCGQLAELAPVLRKPGDHEYEDDLTLLLRNLLGQRFLKLGWQVSSQERGGYTKEDPKTSQGGVAERDLRVALRDTPITIAEAVRIFGWNSSALELHYQKLFAQAHATLRTRFHVVYSWAPDRKNVWKKYGELVQNHLPAGYRFIREEAVDPSVVTAPPGILVSRSVLESPQAEECHVVHILVDLAQATEQNVGKNLPS